MKINVILLQTTKLSFYNKIVKAHFHEEIERKKGNVIYLEKIRH